MSADGGGFPATKMLLFAVVFGLVEGQLDLMVLEPEAIDSIALEEPGSPRER